ncbi:hypothetical protein HYX12_00245 [Candidatus Woesearchaeota archaeon]|nr:hypothetical protein [Candidatus Woesearchaeota archaeon]
MVNEPTDKIESIVKEQIDDPIAMRLFRILDSFSEDIGYLRTSTGIYAYGTVPVKRFNRILKALQREFCSPMPVIPDFYTATTKAGVTVEETLAKRVGRDYHLVGIGRTWETSDYSIRSLILGCVYNNP